MRESNNLARSPRKPARQSRHAGKPKAALQRLRDCLTSQPGKHPEIIRTLLVKLFSKSFKERRLFEKRQHPKTFINQSFLNSA
ncbi:hypothetical protein CFR75_08090 [Komagataeibacter xylinus]|uniref:Uncharacterized protein n=1 Tax=Komagataeibacter xylinus TaxID=28448 RepID=A0A318PLX3_KOMXY|nr:hypothetical protein [Komagataeibacter xylinus]AZV38882.1 hypothetical protein CXP35_08810 [Komagataeibacter xylinus]PYD57032.1 hypothetical protein CFR75_08090 [Komagataeibacter xylinus]